MKILTANNVEIKLSEASEQDTIASETKTTKATASKR